MRRGALIHSLVPLLSSLLAILGAFLVGGVFLTIMGKDPIGAYVLLGTRALGSSFGITETVIKMAPLLLVSAGLIIALRAGVWNIGIDGQFLIGAAAVGVVAPRLAGVIPLFPMLLICGLTAFVFGAMWGLIPAVLKVSYGLNEIITTIMMNFVAIYVTSWLVKGPFRDTSVVAPQMPSIPKDWRLPHLPLTRVHIGVVVGIIIVLAVFFMFRRGTIGFSFNVMGLSRKAAVHAGIPVERLVILALLLSAGMAGLAGANDVLGVKGLFQGEWNPAYGFTGFALVFLARLNGLAIIPFAYFFAFLLFGGEMMARTAGIPVFFVEMLEGLMLVFFAISVYFERTLLRKVVQE